MTVDSDQGCCWPEQNAVREWLDKYEIEVSASQAYELSRAVSQYRIEIQDQMKSQRIALMPWWRKDRHGWPITHYPGKPFKSFVRLIFQNVRKITG